MFEWLAGVGYRTARRIVVTLVGGTVLLLGVAMIVLPGPATIVIPVGLAILGIEWAWARRFLRQIREKGGEAIRKVGLRRPIERAPSAGEAPAADAATATATHPDGSSTGKP